MDVGWRDHEGEVKAHFYEFLMNLTRGIRPLWLIAFSLWDDEVGCGCWRETGRHRWSDR